MRITRAHTAPLSCLAYIRGPAVVINIRKRYSNRQTGAVKGKSDSGNKGTGQQGPQPELGAHKWQSDAEVEVDSAFYVSGEIGRPDLPTLASSHGFHRPAQGPGVHTFLLNWE